MTQKQSVVLDDFYSITKGMISAHNAEDISVKRNIALMFTWAVALGNNFGYFKVS